jgi:N-terminal region of glycosyl transferase group 7/N-terminal domain of galactosyltransferase
MSKLNSDVPVPVPETTQILEPIIETSTIPNMQSVKIIPKIIFIIPYRDREEHKIFFSVYMKHVLEDLAKTDYEIYYVEQKNTLPFNRGAMKNIGFLAIKYKYPDHYKNISFVFNDIDTVPYTKNIINYEANAGTVKHFYGFKFALGGIFSIKGGDYERTNGFPNFWSWGGEDNYMQKRAEQIGLVIDRSCFFNILDKNILQLCDGIKRLICRKEAATVVNMTTMDGLITIRNLNYDFKDEYINVYHFETTRDPRTLRFEEQNIAVESKIRLEKDDVKNLLQRKMNEVRVPVFNPNQAQHQYAPRTPLPQPQPQRMPQRTPPPQPQRMPQRMPQRTPPPQPQRMPHPQHDNMHHPGHRGNPGQNNMNNRIGMGGISK